MGTFNQTGLTEMVLVNLDGQYTCGVPGDGANTTLRAGWQAATSCDCANEPIDPSCALMAEAPFPFSIVGTSPPLCGLQKGPPFWNRWKTCNPLTCKSTRCNVHGRRGAALATAGVQAA